MAKGRSVFTESVKNIFKRYFVDAMGAMTFGLFASLIIGTIIEQIFKLPFLAQHHALVSAISYIKSAAGAAIGVSVACGLKSTPMVIFSSAATGMIGYALGGPLGGYLAAVIGAELGNLVAGRTPVDIVLTPITTVISGGLVGIFVGPYINKLMTLLGSLVQDVTEFHPIFMGIIIAVIVGMLFATPLSAAALCISIDIGGIAAGAACIGCCCQAVGFAVASYKDNGLGGFLAQSMGTPMLQFPNIIRRPQIWLAPIISSAILGPVSTALLGMTNNYTGAGMGSCGLVGQIQAYHTLIGGNMHPLMAVCMIIIMHFIAPAALTLVFDTAFRKLGWIRKGDMKIKKF